MSDEFSGEVISINELVEEIIPNAQVWHFDFDHTLSSEGATKDDEFRLALELQSDKAIENRNNLIEASLNGQAISIITARDRTAFIIADAIQQEILVRLRTRGHIFDGKRYLASDGVTPVLFLFSNANGANTWELLSPDHRFINQTKLQQKFWECITDSRVMEILRASATDTTRDELLNATPQYIDLDKPLITNIETAMLAIGDFALVSPSGTRVNLSLDHVKISANQDLKAKWAELTGIIITDRYSLLAAMEVLTKDWGIYFTGSASMPTLDIMDGSVNKSNCVDLVNKYIQQAYARYGLQLDNFESLQIGDTPYKEDYKGRIVFRGNDGPMINRRGGISVAGIEHIAASGFPCSYTPYGTSKVANTNLLIRNLRRIRGV